MSTSCRFAYAQARVQARFAGLPGEEAWQALAASRSLAAFLEDARSGALRDWVKGFSGQSDVHDLEAGVRVQFRETADELARWVPAPWAPAVRWSRWLILLPLLDHLARGGAVPGWVRRDPGLARFLAEDGTLDGARLGRLGAAPLLGADDPAGAWLAEWRSRWPRCSREALGNLGALAGLLGEHLSAFREAPPRSAWELRAALSARLRHLFHRRLLQPAGVFTYLVLVALELERLRAELVTRVLFPEEGA
jgi:hypothetical protein